jgi:hypothetical protein
MINDKLKSIVPVDSESYNVSLDTKLANAGIDIMNWLLDNDKLEASHSFNDIDYRWVFGISGTNSTDYIMNNLPAELAESFKNDVIEYLGLSTLSVNEIKFECIGPNQYVDDIHLKRCRFGEIEPVLEDDMPFDYEHSIFYSALWHTDKSFELNNYKLLVYLNDIDIDQGGLMIADPIMSPKMIDEKCVLHEEGKRYKADSIEGHEVIGKPGTCASFNSHILHRANLPKAGYRHCMHLSFLLPGDEHKHDIYSKNHIKNN